MYHQGKPQMQITQEIQAEETRYHHSTHSIYAEVGESTFRYTTTRVYEELALIDHIIRIERKIIKVQRQCHRPTPSRSILHRIRHH